MAYGPCPKCQTHEEFNKLFETLPNRKAFATAGYLVMDSRPSTTLRCSKDDSHVWGSPDDAAADLKAAGYLSHY